MLADVEALAGVVARGGAPRASWRPATSAAWAAATACAGGRRSATRVEFDFTVDEVDEPRRMAGRASGELEGTGVWRLFEEGGVTAVDLRVAGARHEAVDEGARAAAAARCFAGATTA